MLLGRYEVTAELGRGASGTVYRARTSDGQDVAIKILASRSAAARARFERERRLLGSLGEGFVPLLDAGETPQGDPFIVMPFVGGGTLRDRMQRGPLAIEEARLLGLRVADALGRAHAKGIVHRDLKPENILYTGTGEPLVADLGLAKHFDGGAQAQSVSLSTTGAFRGTAGYMAPEQTVDAKEADARADVFSLACVLYEALGGVPAFAGDSILVVLEQLETCRVKALREVRPEVPRALAAAIGRALARDPDDRFAEGAAFAAALRAGAHASGPSVTKVALSLGLGALLLTAVTLVALALGLGGAPSAPAVGPRTAATPSVPAPVASAALTAQTHFTRAREHMAANRAREAIAEFTLGLEKTADRDAFIERGQLRQVCLNDLDGAYDDYCAAVELDPKSAVAVNLLGAVLSAKGLHREAITHFRLAAELDPRFTIAWVNLGNNQSMVAELDGAIESYTKALVLEPTHADALRLRGEAKLRTRDTTGAFADLTRARELNPKSARAFVSLAACCMTLERYDDVFEAASRAVELEPGRAAAWQLRGIGRRMARGDIEGAIEDELQAWRLDPHLKSTNVSHWRERGDKRAANGDVRGAIADYEVFVARAQASDPDLEKVRARLAELKARSGG